MRRELLLTGRQETSQNLILDEAVRAVRQTAKSIVEIFDIVGPNQAEAPYGYDIAEAKPVSTHNFTGVVIARKREDLTVNPEAQVGEESLLEVLGVQDNEVIHFTYGSGSQINLIHVGKNTEFMNAATAAETNKLLVGIAEALGQTKVE